MRTLVYLELYELATYFEYRLRTQYKFTTEQILDMQKTSIDAAEEYIKVEDELDLKYEKARWKKKEIERRKKERKVGR